MHALPIGRGRRLKEGTDIAVLSLGPIGVSVVEAIKQLQAERPDLSIAHYDMRYLKPLDDLLLTEAATRCRRIITIEDGVRNGGFGSAVLEWLADHGMSVPVQRLGLPDAFVEHGSIPELRHLCGIDVEGIKQALTH